MKIPAILVLALTSAIALPLQAHAGVIRDANRVAAVKSVVSKGVKVTKDAVGFVKFVGPCVARRLIGGRC